MKIFGVLAVVSLLVGCGAAPVKPVAMEKDYLYSGTKKVGVVLAKMPVPDVYLPGADCLLCIGVAEMANSTLSTHVETLKPDDFSLVKSELVERLKEKGVDVIAIDENIEVEKLPEFQSEVEGVSKHDYSAYSSKYDITQLLVIDINSLGIQRKYASYVPTSDPKAVVAGAGYLVELSTNTYKWYKNIEVYKSASGNWDEPPSFPALTNAYYQVIEAGRENILSEF